MDSFFLKISNENEINENPQNLKIKCKGKQITIKNNDKVGRISLDNIYFEKRIENQDLLKKIQQIQIEIDTLLNSSINLKKKSDSVFQIVSQLLFSNNYDFKEEINFVDFYSLSVDHTSMQSIMESSENENSQVQFFFFPL